ncbi:CaiB/BaiF CoA transferase family protein [Sciscionella marina]|uniref:CaiB/BaiF CoA transferase family protein n=1 Tax=Sciscionella marina TaxID=508770 RepID=UPI00047646B4|nr:CaiB/BaiF CoA-transferase family protein [Sciscionella marina]
MSGAGPDRHGPLAGFRVVEIASLGPGPFCCMMLADLGADVIRIDRVTESDPVGPGADHATELLNRGRPSVAVDLKHPDSVALVLDLVARADILVEGFRPGVAERLGIGPDVCTSRNPRLIYGRTTGYGQDGPAAHTVGHDLNYLAANGVLSMIGRQDQPPTPPLNLIGDIGGGGLVLAFGLLAALLERERSNRGQVVDAAMIDGAALLAAPFYAWAQTGQWSAERGTNMIDSGAPYYDAYETNDGRWLSVAAVEPAFYATLLEILGLTDEPLPEQEDRAGWPIVKKRFAEVIGTRTLNEWCARAEGKEVCVAPVLTPHEVESDPHLRARGTFTRNAGIVQPVPAPRFGRTPAALSMPPPRPGEHTRSALLAWGIEDSRIRSLLALGALVSREDSTLDG